MSILLLQNDGEIRLTVPIATDRNLEQGIFITPVIKGKLDSVIFNLPIDCHLTILSELGYTIFQRQVSGAKYIPIRSDIENVKGERYNFQSDKFLLNEKIFIVLKPLVKGVIKQATIIIRYDPTD